jgi:hypothetical protein
MAVEEEIPIPNWALLQSIRSRARRPLKHVDTRVTTEVIVLDFEHPDEVCTQSREDFDYYRWKTRISAYRVFEFGQLIDFDNARQVNNLVEKMLRTIHTWRSESFDRTATNWLSEHPYRALLVSLLVRVAPRTARLMRLNEHALQLPLTTEIVDRQGSDLLADLNLLLITASMTFFVLFIAHVGSRITPIVKTGVRRVAATIARTGHDVTRIADSFADVSTASREVADFVSTYLEPIAQWLKSTYNLFYTAFSKVGVMLDTIKRYVQFLCVWAYQYFIDQLGPMARFIATPALRAAFPELAKLDFQFGPQPQSSFSWLSMVMKFVFGVSVPISLPAFRSGVTALGWIAQNGYALLSTILGYITGVPYPMNLFEQEILTHYERIHDLATKVSSMSAVALRVSPDTTVQYTTEAEWYKTFLIKNANNIGKLHGGWSTIFSNMSRLLETIGAKVKPAARLRGNRPVPVMVNFWGAPGVGKSTFIKESFLPAVHRELGLIGVIPADEYQEPKHTWTKNMEEEYWDGFCSQTMHYLFFDDIYQVKKVESRTMISSTLISVVNSAAYNPPIADMNQKGVTPVESLLVVSSSNENWVANPHDFGITDTKAVTSRVMFNVEVKRAKVGLLDKEDFVFHITGSEIKREGRVVTDFTASELLGLVVNAIYEAVIHSHVKPTPLQPSPHSFDVVGPRGQTFTARPGLLEIIGPDPFDAKPQGYYYDQLMVFAAINIPLSLIGLLCDCIIKEHIRGLPYGREQVIQYFKSYVLTLAFWKGVSIAYHAIFPAPAAAPEEWGAPGANFTLEAPLDDELTLSKWPAPNPLTTGEPVEPQGKMGDTWSMKDGKKGKNKDHLRDIRPKLRKMKHRDDYDDVDYQAGPEVNASQLWKSISTDLGSVTVVTSEFSKYKCFMFGLKDHKWIMPLHMIMACQRFEFARTYNGVPIAIEYKDFYDVCQPQVLSVGVDQVDAVIVTLEMLPPVKDRRRQWCPKLPQFPRIVRFYPRMERIDGKDTEVVWVSISERTKYVSGYGYNLGVQDMFNEGGDCGLPAIDLSTGLICGIQTAGNERKRESFFTTFPQSTFDILGPSAQCSVQDSFLPTITSVGGRSIPGTSAVGKVDSRYYKHVNSKTALTPSRLSLPWPKESAPARLIPFERELPDGTTEWVSPLQIANSKLGARPTMVYNKDLPNLIDHYLLPRTPPHVKAQIATWEEAAFGSEALSIPPLDKDTSVGPYFRSKGLKQRSDLLDFDEKKLRPVLQQRCDEIWDALDRGPIPLWVEADLKDELRDLERVALGKSRLFYVMDIAFLIVQNRLCGNYASLIKADPTIGTCAVGINPTSIQWGQLRKRFEIPGNLWAFDIKGYDIHIRSPSLLRCADAQNQRMVVEQRRVQNMYLSLGLQFHVQNSMMYHVGDINPSGHIMTSIVGSMVNTDCISTFAHVKNLEVDFTTYSDDNIIIHPFKNGVSQRPVIKEFCEHAEKNFGLIYTSVEKDDNLAEITISQAEFLSRNFVPRDGLVWAPLPKSTIRAMLQWVRSDTSESEVEQIRQRCSSALLEALQHPPSFYEEIKEGVLNLASEYHFNPKVLPYDSMRAVLIAQHYSA